MKTCPECEGKKRVEGTISQCRGPNAGFRKISLDCWRCEGVGRVAAEVATRIADGKRMRLDRIARNFSPLSEAKRLGITVLELSDLEFGMTPEDRKRQAKCLLEMSLE